MTLDQFLQALKEHRETIEVAKKAVELANNNMQSWLKETVGFCESEPISIESMVTLFVKAKNLA